MICRSCGQIYFKENKNKVCKKCYTNNRVREKKFYTVKTWKKFDVGIQEKLSGQYEIILEPQKTVKDKVKSIFKRSDPEKRKARREKIVKTIKKIIKGTTSKSGSNKMGKLASALGNPTTITPMISQHRQTLAGKKSKGIKLESSSNQNFDGLLGKSKIDYSGLVSKRKELKL